MTQTAVSTAISQAIFGYLLMAAIAVCTAFIIRGIVITLAATKKKAPTAAPTPVMVSVQPARDENAAIAAAIGAAVYAVLGAHRLVYIGDAQHGFTWTSEIRTRLHTSHMPRR